MAHLAPAEDFLCLESEDALKAGTLGFMPRILVLTTLPHRRPESHRFERVNGRHTLRVSAPRKLGLPYGSYARLLLAYLTTEAVRNKKREIDLGATPNDLARKLGLSTISGPRGTARRLENQLHRLQHMRLEWQTSMGLAPSSSGSSFAGAVGVAWWKPMRHLFPRRAAWRSHIELGPDFFGEITRSAVPIDLRAIRQLRRSPLAIDLYVWLSYRMSYLKKPTLVSWQGLQNQFGADYCRGRDFRRHFLERLSQVVGIYQEVRVASRSTGLLLLPSPAHVPSRRRRQGSLTS